MTAVFSTSSPVASVALFASDGALLGSLSEEAPRAASGACLKMLERLLEGRPASTIDLFVADTGPGSFTGVKVAVTLAKVLAFATGKKAAGVFSFDLVSARDTVVIPSKKGEWFVRRLGSAPKRVQELPEEPFVGYGPGVEEQSFPNASRADPAGLDAVDAEQLFPTFFAEPSISLPKQPYRTLSAEAGPG